MHFCHCEHPLRIYNKYLGEYIYVPCRKCNSCRNIYTFQWANRIATEMKYHQYVYHITLQYDDDHCPLLVKIGNKLVSKVKDSVDDNIVIRIPKVLTDFEKEYYATRKLYPYCRKRDIQLFFKRLRKQVSKFDPSEKIRYVVAAEYGPTTFRAHYHLLLFSDSQKLHKRLREVVSSCWQNGYVYARRCSKDDKASQYVSKYVVHPTDCPSIYQNQQIKPFFLCSKCPPIGSYKDSTSDVVETLFKGTPFKRCTTDDRKETYDIPLSRYCENYLFPKLKSYDQWNCYERITLYGLFKTFGCCQWQEFKQRCLAEYRKKSFLGRYISHFLIHEYDKEYNSLKNLWFQGKRVFDNMVIFGVSLRDYVTLIDNYYNNKAKYKLKKQLAYEEIYFRNLKGTPLDLLSMDRQFCHDLEGEIKTCTFSQKTFSVLSQFEDFDLYSFSPDNTLDSKSLCVSSSKLSKDMSKNKYANDHFTLSRFNTTIKHFI